MLISWGGGGHLGTLRECSSCVNAHLCLSHSLSLHIPRHRYNIDSLMTRYQGVDWRMRRADLVCNMGKNPQAEHMNDGLDLDPFEVLFVKSKAFPRVASTHEFLARYTAYFMGRDDLASNDFASPRMQAALENERAELQRRVEHCNAVFDGEFYFATNPDLAGAVNQTDALKHWDEYGFLERRPYRFTSTTRRRRAAAVRGKEGEAEDDDECRDFWQ